jgi:hypothetical protein
MSTENIIDSPTVIVGIIPIILDTFSINAYRSAKYTLSIVYPDGNAQLAEILAVHNKVDDAKYTLTASPVTGSSTYSLLYTVSLQSGMCVLSAISNVIGVDVKLQKTYFAA